MSALASFPRITPFLWFDTQAGEAADFYIGIFPNSRRLETFHDPRSGNVLTVAFELDGVKFTALNGGPHTSFNEAISLVVRCADQAEVDYYWERLTADGEEIQCGWLKDKFGVRWQVVPARAMDLLRHRGAMEAMLGMRKLDLAALEKAAAGE